ncbi:LOW QUALITY PROTEIN: T-complex protein 11 homolog [Phoenicopterus ruber ruber]
MARALFEASPPQVLSMNERQQVTDDISKLTIAHKIVLSSDFNLQAAAFSPNGLENRVKETLHEAFWDSLEEQLSAGPPDTTRAIQLLTETKEALLSLLLPRHSQLRSRIEEALEGELVRQEAERGALDIHGLTAYVLGTMERLRAPIRDEEIRHIPVAQLQFRQEIFRVLGLMKMDVLNFTIPSLPTYLQDHTVQYERKKFQELDKLPNSLDRTRERLRKAAAEASASSSQPPPHPAAVASPAARSPRAVSGSTTVPSLGAALNRGHVNLLCWEPGQKEYPETLFVDRARLQAVRAQVNQLPNTAAVLLVTSGMCGGTLWGSPGLVAMLKGITEALLEGLSCTRYEGAVGDISDRVLQEVSRTHSCVTLLLPRTDVLPKGQTKSIADKGNALHSVIGLMGLSIVKPCSPVPQQQPSSEAATQSSRFIPSSAFSFPPMDRILKDFPKGLDSIREELLGAGRGFGSVLHHNRQVFGRYYPGILEKMLLPDAEPDSHAARDSF